LSVPVHAGRRALPGLEAFGELIHRRNPAVHRFQALGYSYVHVQPGRYVFFGCAGLEQRCLGPAGAPELTDEARAFLLLTVAHAVLERVAPRLVATELTTVPDATASLGGPLPSPRLVFAHVLQPHERIYDTACRRRPPARRDDRGAYAATARCALRQVVALTDTILARDPGAVIALLSDHGSDFLVPWERPPQDWPAAAVRERMSIMAAFRLPAPCRSTVPPDVATVNVLRVVLACVEGKAPSLLRDSVFLATRHGSAVVAVPRP
jgi:hypothetical protein